MKINDLQGDLTGISATKNHCYPHGILARGDIHAQTIHIQTQALPTSDFVFKIESNTFGILSSYKFIFQ